MKQAEIITIPKPQDPTSSRPISLLKVMSKVMEQMAKARIKKAVGSLYPGIFGYINSVGTTEAIATSISEISEVCKMKNMAAIVVFLDLTRAFETCSREVILEQLMNKGLKGNLLAYISELLKNCTAAVWVQGHLSSYRALTKGTHQGGVLSPILFNLPMEYLVAAPYPKESKVDSYADDLKQFTKAHGTVVLRIAQETINILADKADYLGMTFSPQSTKLCVLGWLHWTQTLSLREYPFSGLPTTCCLAYM